MGNYILSCCSMIDLTKKQIEDRDIKVIFGHYSLDEKEYRDDFGETISYKDFYQAMVDGADTKTWQINSTEFAEHFEQFVSQGYDVVHLSLSSGLSGTFNSASYAAEQVNEKYPDRHVYVIDSLGASSGYGMIIDKMADLRDEGMAAEDLVKWVEENRLKMRYEFFSTDLTFYIKGGRVSKASGMVGTLLGICPLLDVDIYGKLIPRKKVRTKKKVMTEIVKLMEERAQNGYDYSDKCYICHSDCLEDAEAVKALIKEKFPKIKGDVEIYDIGTSIGSHTGPGTAAIFYWGSDRTE